MLVIGVIMSVSYHVVRCFVPVAIPSITMRNFCVIMALFAVGAGSDFVSSHIVRCSEEFT